MDIETVKEKALQEIEARAAEIIAMGERIWRSPELGFKEFKTAEITEEAYRREGWSYQSKLAITGSKAWIAARKTGPTVGIVGELDALRVTDHKECDPITGAVHSCGHNAQVACMIGAGYGLQKVTGSLAGNVALIAVPAEEYVEIDFRNSLRGRGQLEFFGGKQELLRLGVMDDVDISLGSHTDTETTALSVGGSNNGFIGKMVRYVGREAHAGGAPHKGVNALNAAMLGVMGVHANRETFRDEDTIRVHPIITKGGEIVNNVPSDVRIESYVRGKTVEAIRDANAKVNRALRAGAMAVGAECVIDDHPGYMPYVKDAALDEVVRVNSVGLVGEDRVKVKGHSTGSTDLGDFSCVMPTASIGMGGVAGIGHGRDYRIVDGYTAYVLPSKVLALTTIDLLHGDAAKAKKIIASFTPSIPRAGYTEFMKRLASG